ncbi:hypothetical protein M1N18_00125 [Dehalococcoidales bacterium]|nr:hypothetical protein [Dehalococcoidales bacterium]
MGRNLPIPGYVLRRTASIEIAQDITSEVFFKALKNLGQFRYCGFPFSSWLYRIKEAGRGEVVEGTGEYVPGEGFRLLINGDEVLVTNCSPSVRPF